VWRCPVNHPWPGRVRWFAENQPITSIVETLRALIEDQPVGNDIRIALAWIVGIGVAAYVVATRRYNKTA
jgi:ABC-2 type transport system permease protein